MIEIHFDNDCILSLSGYSVKAVSESIETLMNMDKGDKGIHYVRAESNGEEYLINTDKIKFIKEINE